MKTTAISPLDRPEIYLLARLVVTAPFWLSALSKSINFDMGAAEMARVGLEPAAAFNIATIIVQTAGALLIISGHYVSIGAAMLGLFTMLTIPLVHHFWTMTEEPFRTIAMHTASEHIGLIGGLLGIAVLSTTKRQNTSST